MFRNLKLRNKLIAIIAAPLAALVAFAAIGSLQRRDTAQSARLDGKIIALAAQNATLAQALEAESAQAVAAVLAAPPGAQNSAAKDAIALRRATDVAVGDTNAAAANLDPQTLRGATREALATMNELLIGIGNLRTAIDSGGLPWSYIADTYSQTTSSVVVVGQQLAGDVHRPQVQSGLANLAALAQLKANISQNANLLSGALAAGNWPDPETKARFIENADAGEADLAVFKAGATPAAATAFRSADSTAAASLVDTVFGVARQGRLDQALQQRAGWTSAVAAKLTKLHDVEAGVGAAIAADNASRVNAADRSATLFILVAIAVTLLALLIAGMAARSLARRMRILTDAADRLSERELPRLVAALENPDEDELGRLAANLEPIDVSGKDELGRLAASFNHVQRVAVDVASEQATLLQRGIADTFVNLARRNQGLLDRQIEFIDQLELSETDPQQLEDLFKLDHLATRMRRNAESLLVLAGAEPTRRRGEPVQLASVVRAAIGEVEDFARIDLLTFDPVYVTRNASVDVTHLLAELMDNAAAFSPPDTRVEVAGHRSSTGGYVLTITDRGIGMTEAQLHDANELLADPPVVGLSLSRKLGFIVVGRLAGRFDIGVRLFAGSSGGVTAAVTLPPPLVVEQPDEPDVHGTADEAPVGRSGDTTTNDLDPRWDLDELLEAERPVDLREPVRGDDGRQLPRRTRRDTAPATASGTDVAPRAEEAAGMVEGHADAADGSPPLPVLDAGAPLRFGELPVRSPRNREEHPEGHSVPEVPAVPVARGEAIRPNTDGQNHAPIPRAPIHFGNRPELLHDGHLDAAAHRTTADGGSVPSPAQSDAPAPLPTRRRPEPAPIPAAHDAPELTPDELPEPVPVGGELARRVPGAARKAQSEAQTTPKADDGVGVVAPSTRSAEEVRSVLSRYRGGLDRGRSRRNDD